MSHLNMMATTIWECSNKLSIHRYFAMAIGLFLAVTFWAFVNWFLVLCAGIFLIIYGKFLQPLYIFRSSRFFWIYVLKKAYYQWRHGKSGLLKRTISDFLEKASDYQYATIHGIPEFEELSYRLGRFKNEPELFKKQIEGNLSGEKRQLVIDICLFLLVAEIVALYDTQGSPIETSELLKNINSSNGDNKAFIRLNNLSKIIAESNNDIDSDLFNFIYELFTGDKK